MAKMTSPAKVYGIPNCDTVKKALVWLKKHHIPVEFHDYKKEGISKEKLQEWCALQPLDLILNKKSTAWKELSPTQQEKAATPAGALKLMQEYNNLVKRPVIEIPGTILIGFNEASYKSAFKL